MFSFLSPEWSKPTSQKRSFHASTSSKIDYEDSYRFLSPPSDDDDFDIIYPGSSVACRTPPKHKLRPAKQKTASKPKSPAKRPEKTKTTVKTSDCEKIEIVISRTRTNTSSVKSRVVRPAAAKNLPLPPEKEKCLVVTRKILQEVYSDMTPAGANSRERFNNMLSSKKNVRMKISKGSDDPDSWKSDTDTDKRIIRSLKNPDIPVKLWDAARMRKQWDVIQSDPFLTARDKEHFRERYSELRDVDGCVIIRRNASYDVY